MSVLFKNFRRMFQNAGQYRRGDIECRYPPVRFWIEPTSLCNLKCPMCPTGIGETGEQPAGTMSLDMFKRIVDEIRDFAVDINLFYRGESLLNKQLPEMIRYAADSGLRTRLETNATFLDREWAGALIEAGLDFLSFSVDGYNAEAYEAIRRGARFEETLEKVRGFLEEKKARGGKKPYTIFQVIELKEVKEQTTDADRQGLRERFKGLPLDQFKVVQPHRFSGQINETVTGNHYAYVDGSLRLSKVAYLPCPYLWYSLVIGWDGVIVPCCMDFSGRYILGQVGEDRILDVWNGEWMKDLRTKIVSEQYRDIPMCSQCDILWQQKVGGVSVKNLRDLGIFLRESLV